jgi:hypothetical protein
VSRFFPADSESSHGRLRRTDRQTDPAGQKTHPAERGDWADRRQSDERQDVQAAREGEDAAQKQPGSGGGAPGHASGQDPQGQSVNQVVENGRIPGVDRTPGDQPVVNRAMSTHGTQQHSERGEQGGEAGQGGGGHAVTVCHAAALRNRGAMKLCESLVIVIGLASSALAEAPAPGPITFNDLPAGPPPASLMVVDGEWSIIDEAGDRRLELHAEPVVDAAILLGPSLKEGGAVRANVRAAQSRRAFPRFGVGLFGLSGVKARVVPAQKKIELLQGDEVIAETPFDGWKPDSWWSIELKVTESGGAWTAEARVWADGTPVPATPTLTHSLPANPGQGRASLIGSPFANKPVHFDLVVISEANDQK